MKKLGLFVAVLAAFQVHAQSTKTIEVTVTDTVELKVKSAVFIVSFENPEAYNWNESYYNEESFEEPEIYSEETTWIEEENGGKKDRKSKKDKKNKKEEAPIEIVEEMVFEEEEEMTFVPDFEQPITINPSKEQFIAFLKEHNIEMDSVQVPTTVYDYMDEGNFRMKVVAKNLEEIKLINGYRDSIDFIAMKVNEVQTESMDEQLKPVYDRLYAKAKKEASVIAAVTGMKLGLVIKVSTPNSPLDPLLEMQAKAMEQLSKTLGKDNKMETQKKMVSRTFVFEAK